MLIYIIRHGETNANIEGRLQGQTDTELNEKGIRLAIETGIALKDISFKEVISSPLKRARNTAELIIKNNNNPATPISFSDDLKEMNMGDWEGKIILKDKCELGDEIKTFLVGDFSFKGFPNGETMQQLCQRGENFLRNLAARDDDATYLVSTHGAAMRGMLNFLYENREDFWHGHVPYNCAVNIVEAKNGEIKLIEEDLVFYNKDEVVDRYRDR